MRGGFLDVVQDWLLVDPELVNFSSGVGESLLMVACGNCNLEICNLLISSRADLTKRNRYGDMYPHTYGWSALHYSVGTSERYASIGGNIEITKLLLKSKADVNITDQE